MLAELESLTREESIGLLSSAVVGLLMPSIVDQAEVLQERRQTLATAMSGWRQKFPEVKVHELVVPEHPISVLSCSG
jgi:hypothetical protein